jgi:steroid delta-isomerase-like uncharacterized protein
MPETNHADAAVSERLRIVDEHIHHENRHDLDGIATTFGQNPRYDDEPWDAHYVGREQVRAFYAQILTALPDLHIDVLRRHVAYETVIVEVTITGHHLGTWRGLPATGRAISFPLCGIYTFDAANRLAGEKIYYDRAMVLRQLGFFHEPDSLRGRLAAAVTHPLTMVRLLAGRVR